MDLVTLIKIMGRRWWVTVPILIATVVAAANVQSDAPREFEVSGTVLIATPDLDSSRLPLTVVDVPSAVAQVSDDETADRAVAADGTDDFQVRRVSSTRVEVRVRASGPAANRTAEFVLDELSTIILDRQEAAELPVDEWLVPITEVFEADADVPGQDVDVEIPEGTTLGVLDLYDPAADFENPYGADGDTAQVLRFAAESDLAHQRMMDLIRTEDIEFEVSAEGGPGILAITALAPTPDGALSLFDGITDFLAEQLDVRQERAGVPTTRKLQIEVLAMPEQVEDVSPPLARLAVAVFTLGALVMVGLVLLVENLAPRLGRLWRSRSQEGSPDTPRASADARSIVTPAGSATPGIAGLRRDDADAHDDARQQASTGTEEIASSAARDDGPEDAEAEPDEIAETDTEEDDRSGTDSRSESDTVNDPDSDPDDERESERARMFVDLDLEDAQVELARSEEH